MNVLPQEKLDFWMENNVNVLMIGKHGIGKTAAIKEAFGRNKSGKKSKALYFNCATLDPWVDFIGVPKVMGEGDDAVVELIRPKVFSDENIEFIFLDELNRAKPAIQNALLELINTKSINGRKLKNLRCVWAAINPPAENMKQTSYNVEHLDVALLTRFTVRYNVAFDLDETYFVQKFGRAKYDALHDWWHYTLEEKQRDLFPPRSIDLAMDYLAISGDVEDCLPQGFDKQAFLSAATSDSEFAKYESGVIQNSLFQTMIPDVLKKTINDLPEHALKDFIENISNEEAFQVLAKIDTTQNVSVVAKKFIQALPPKVRGLILDFKPSRYGTGSF